MRTIAIVNQKGGVGKTTTSINLAACLALVGKRTLLVDMDPQGHCAVGLAVPEEQIEQSLYDVLVEATAAETTTTSGHGLELSQIIWQIGHHFDLAPSTIDLAAFEQRLSGVEGREDCLRRQLESLAHRYDFVIIDCPPNVGLLTFNALRAATEVLVPVETGYFSYHALTKQLQTLQLLCNQCQQQIRTRVLATQYDLRTKLARELLADLRKEFNGKMLKTVINFNTKLKEASSFGQPISEFAPTSRGYTDFRDLAAELIDEQPAESSVRESEPGEQALLKEAELISRRADQLISQSRELLGSTAPRPRSMAKIQLQKEDSDRHIQLHDSGDSDAGLIRLASSVIDTSHESQEDRADEQQLTGGSCGVQCTDQGAVFKVEFPQASRVLLAGDFNDWSSQATPLAQTTDGKWKVCLPLMPGRYRYRFIVDGEWREDPWNDYVESNPFGGVNSVVDVQ